MLIISNISGFNIISSLSVHFFILYLAQQNFGAMKKFLLLVITFSISISCSTDDDNRFVENDYVSDIKIDDKAFMPSPRTASKSYVTTWAYGGVSEIKTRVFSLVKHNDKEELRESMDIVITYKGTTATGTYSLPENWFIDNESDLPYYDGAFSRGFEYNAFSGGTITINEIGDNKFRIQFNAVQTGSLPAKTINGSFEGTFTYEAPIL